MFAPGDEIICVDATHQKPGGPLVKDAVYVVSGHNARTSGLYLAGVANRGPGWWGHNPDRFRKVQKRRDTRNLTEWLSQPSGYDEEEQNPAPKAPAKKRERA